MGVDENGRRDESRRGTHECVRHIAGARWALAAALFGVLFFFRAPDFRVCGFYWLTGHPCALCGMTRAMFALAKGHLGEAVRFHALAPLGFAMVFAVLGDVKISGRMWTVVLATFAVYGVCRVFVTQ